MPTGFKQRQAGADAVSGTAVQRRRQQPAPAGAEERVGGGVKKPRKHRGRETAPWPCGGTCSQSRLNVLRRATYRREAWASADLGAHQGPGPTRRHCGMTAATLLGTQKSHVEFQPHGGADGAQPPNLHVAQGSPVTCRQFPQNPGSREKERARIASGKES